jgi:hypothetical protein
MRVAASLAAQAGKYGQNIKKPVLWGKDGFLEDPALNARFSRSG